MSLICGTCKLPMQDMNEEHYHAQDVFLYVSDCQALVARTVGNKETGTDRFEYPDLELPEDWVNFVLDSCGGSINQSGHYRLPGMIAEYVLFSLAGQYRNFLPTLKDKINEFIKPWKEYNNRL